MTTKPMSKSPSTFAMTPSPSTASTPPVPARIPTPLKTLNFPFSPNELSRRNLPPFGLLFSAPPLPVSNRSLRSSNDSPPSPAGPPLVASTGPSQPPHMLSRGSSSSPPRPVVVGPPPVGVRSRSGLMNSPPPRTVSSPPPCSGSVLVSYVLIDSVSNSQNKTEEESYLFLL